MSLVILLCSAVHCFVCVCVCAKKDRACHVNIVQVLFCFHGRGRKRIKISKSKNFCDKFVGCQKNVQVIPVGYDFFYI